MSKYNIIIIHDCTKIKDLLLDLFKKEDLFFIQEFKNFNSAVDKLKKREFNLAITDFSTTETSRNSAFSFFIENYPEVKCIAFPENPTIKDAVYAIKSGAFDYLTASLSYDEIIFSLKKAAKETTDLKLQDSKATVKFSQTGEIVGESKEILSVFKTILKVARSDSTVLITGESGTGKELIARAIHYNSNRDDKPMVIINCGAIPSELLESELFGHEKGSFTGAHRSRIGRFEMANGGTIFLDEIGDMSINLQVKLLRVIQDQTFERVGGEKSIKVNNRIIAATNKNLVSSIEEGKFREDLYYRLNVIPIKIPPLRERKDDIPILVNYFLNRLEDRKKIDKKIFSDEAIDALKQYHWPGNIRELENIIERLSILVDDNLINISDLPEKIRGKSSYDSVKSIKIAIGNGVGFNDAIEQYQKNLILQALNQSKGVKAKAAEILKLNRTTLVEKIKKMKIEAPKEEEFEEEAIIE